ncbi:MAG: HipA domain-containing protein [archaeon]|nr:HipA domain-containing protein [archaeon]
MDFSDFPALSEYYSGSEKKIGILVDGARYILKFQSRDEFGCPYNHVSEHLGSTIFGMLGFEAQSTMLGTYRGENVVACKVFTDQDNQFVPFHDVGDSSLELAGRREPYTYDGIMALLQRNRKLTDLEGTVDQFWNMYVVDGLLGNFDRHGSNWGFLKTDNRYRMAPVFDNGSCLYPRMADESLMETVIGSQEETEQRIFRYPDSQIRLDGGRSSYHEVIGSMGFEECNDAVLRICPRVSLERIGELVDSVRCISDIHRRFYKHMIRSRYQRILLETYERLCR